MVEHLQWDPQASFLLDWEKLRQLLEGLGGTGASDLDSKDWKLSGKQSTLDGHTATSLGCPREGRQDPAGDCEGLPGGLPGGVGEHTSPF